MFFFELHKTGVTTARAGLTAVRAENRGIRGLATEIKARAGRMCGHLPTRAAKGLRTCGPCRKTSSALYYLFDPLVLLKSVFDAFKMFVNSLEVERIGK